MAAPVKRRYINIVGLLHGTLEVNTVQSVSYTDDVQEIAASGDNDHADSFLAQGKATVRGTITLQDPIQAAALRANGKGDLAFSGEPEAGGVAVNVTLKNAIFFTRSETDGHNAVWGSSISFRCYMPDGTSPVVIALDTP